MKFRLLSVVARSDSGYDAHMYGNTHLHDDFAMVSGSAGAGAAADVHDSKTAFLNDELDEKREAVFAAVQGGRMVSCLHFFECAFDFLRYDPLLFVQICTEHVEIDKAEITHHLTMGGASSSSSSSSEVTRRGDAAAKCLLALALCHSTVRDPADSDPTSESSSTQNVAAAQSKCPSLMSCCLQSSSAKDDVSMAGGSAGLFECLVVGFVFDLWRETKLLSPCSGRCKCHFGDSEIEAKKRCSVRACPSATITSFC
jgi:hypothetical protein